MADEKETVTKAAKKTAVKKAAVKKAATKKAAPKKAVAKKAAPKAEAKVVVEAAAPKKAAAARADSAVKRLSVTLVRSRHGRLVPGCSGRGLPASGRRCRSTGSDRRVP